MTTPTTSVMEVTPEIKRPKLTWHGVKTVAKLELTQRLRSSRWRTVLVLWFIGVGAICLLIAAALTSSMGYNDTPVGPTIFALNVMFILFMGLLVTPSLSSTAINGDRNAGTLAILQASLLTPLEITLGKLAAGWVSSVAFIVVSIPFIVWSLAAGGVTIITVVVVLLTMCLLLGVICAVSLYMSARMVKTGTSTVMSYLAVATVSVITLILFGLSTVIFAFGQETTTMQASQWDPDTGQATQCAPAESYVSNPRTNLTWWLLAANPFVLVADVHVAAPNVNPENSSMYDQEDPLNMISVGVRQLRANPVSLYTYEDPWCNPDGSVVSEAEANKRMNEPARQAGPVWPYGIGLYLAIGLLAINRTANRLKTPYDQLAKGVRIA